MNKMEDLKNRLKALTYDIEYNIEELIKLLELDGFDTTEAKEFLELEIARQHVNFSINLYGINAVKEYFKNGRKEKDISLRTEDTKFRKVWAEYIKTLPD